MTGNLKHIILLAGFSFIFTGCQKEIISGIDCEILKEGLIVNDEDLVRNALTGTLGSLFYSVENLNKLTESISGKCDIAATLICFDCIDINPQLSEIKLSFLQSGALIEKVLDISYTDENNMLIVGVHEH